MNESSDAKEDQNPREVIQGWPRWAAAVLTLSGLVVIVVETTSLLFFVGLLLAGLGIYGFVAGSRARRAARRAGERREIEAREIAERARPG